MDQEASAAGESGGKDKADEMCRRYHVLEILAPGVEGKGVGNEVSHVSVAKGTCDECPWTDSLIAISKDEIVVHKVASA